MLLYAVKSSEKSVAGKIQKNNSAANRKSDKTRTHFECYGLRFHIASAIIYYVLLYAHIDASEARDMAADNYRMIKLLKLMELLRQDTDEQHPMKKTDICARMCAMR